MAAECLVGHGHVVVAVDGLASVPTFQPPLDDDADDVVNAIRHTFESVDGVLIAVPEYAGGIAGGLKNALDWMVGSASLYHRPVVVLSAGTTGGQFALEQAVRTLSWQGALVVDTLAVTSPRTKVDAHGRFVDQGTLDAIRRWAMRLVGAVGAPAEERLSLVAAVVRPYGIDPARFGDLPPAAGP